MSIDATTRKIIQNRQRNKIQFQTSFTDFPVYVIYCKEIKRLGSVKKSEINRILGSVRSKFNSGWKQNYDSHASISLLQYNLIKKNGDVYVLDDLGERLVSMFDDENNLIGSRLNFIILTFDMIVSWHQFNDEYDIHPGLILLKLLLEPSLMGCITSQDVAHIFNNSENKKDSQYASFVDKIIKFRNSGTLYSKDDLKKTYTLLTGYVNWGIFNLVNESSDATVKTVVLQKDFEKYCKEQLSKTEEGVLSDSEFTKLVNDTDILREQIEKYAKQYGETGRVTVTYETRVSQIQTAFRNRLIGAFNHKCLLCEITNTEMLIGSHIKRDSECDTINEKIDLNNGFLLCANHDKLFDRYLISFNAFTGKIMISSQLTHAEKEICGLNEDYTLPSELLTPERTAYLIWHNNEYLKKENNN